MKNSLIGMGVIFFVLFTLSYAYSLDAQANTADAKQPAAVQGSDKKEPLNTADMSTTYGKTPFNKLTRGVFNMSTFYFEIPAGAIRVSKEKDNCFIGSTIGTAQGFFACILRAVTGVFDTVTFLIPPYNKPIMQPEYTVQSLEQASE